MKTRSLPPGELLWRNSLRQSMHAPLAVRSTETPRLCQRAPENITTNPFRRASSVPLRKATRSRFSLSQMCERSTDWWWAYDTNCLVVVHERSPPEALSLTAPVEGACDKGCNSPSSEIGRSTLRRCVVAEEDDELVTIPTPTAASALSVSDEELLSIRSSSPADLPPSSPDENAMQRPTSARTMPSTRLLMFVTVSANLDHAGPRSNSVSPLRTASERYCEK